MDGEGFGMAARWRVGEWLADGSMEAVAEINAQCLDFLCRLAVGQGAGAPPRRLPEMFGGQVDAWRGLGAAAQAQLAASPYLLVEAGFDDENRWALPARRMVQDQCHAPREPVFTGPSAADFMRGVLSWAGTWRVPTGSWPAWCWACHRPAPREWQRFGCATSTGWSSITPAGSGRAGSASPACGGTCWAPRANPTPRCSRR